MGVIMNREPSQDAQSVSPGIVAAVGVVAGVMLVVLVLLTLMIIHARRVHKQLLVDLEQRGIDVRQHHAQHPTRANPTRPSAVLRRPSLHPYNTSTGWGFLPSRDSLGTTTISDISTPAGNLETTRSRHRPTLLPPIASGDSIKLKRLATPNLSAIVESPKINTRPHETISPSLTCGGDSDSQQLNCASNQSQRGITTPVQYSENESSDTLLRELRPHPLRDGGKITKTAKLPLATRRNRAKTVSELSIFSTTSTSSPRSSLPVRPLIHSRSISQNSGTAPMSPVPPLPLATTHVEIQGRRGIDRSPSKHSASSYESANSSILGSHRTSPSKKVDLALQFRKGAQNTAAIAGPRPMQKHTSVHSRQISKSMSMPKLNPARHSIAVSPSHKRLSRVSSAILSSATSTWSPSRRSARAGGSMRMSRLHTFQNANCGTPQRCSKSSATDTGSPSELKKSTVLQDVSGNEGKPPMRQLSQASTQASSSRSSNGNPFQWDPAPMQPNKPPSALKGSPGARKGHKRQNCVRISLAPTILGPPPGKRSSCSSIMSHIKEESPQPSSPQSAPPTTKRRNTRAGIELTTPLPPGLFDSEDLSPKSSLRSTRAINGEKEAQKHTVSTSQSSKRSLPSPPSSSIFSPKLMNSQESLPPSSPVLPLTQYYQNIVNVMPTKAGEPLINNRAMNQRMSDDDSIFSIPSFPSPGKGSPQARIENLTGSRSDAPLTNKCSARSRKRDPLLLNASQNAPIRDDSPTIGRINVPSFSDPDPDPYSTILRFSPEEDRTHDATSKASPTSKPPEPIGLGIYWDTLTHDPRQPSLSPPCSPKTIRPPPWSLPSASGVFPTRKSSLTPIASTSLEPVERRRTSQSVSGRTVNPILSGGSLLTDPTKTSARSRSPELGTKPSDKITQPSCERSRSVAVSLGTLSHPTLLPFPLPSPTVLTQDLPLSTSNNDTISDPSRPSMFTMTSTRNSPTTPTKRRSDTGSAVCSPARPIFGTNRKSTTMPLSPTRSPGFSIKKSVQQTPSPTRPTTMSTPLTTNGAASEDIRRAIISLRRMNSETTVTPNSRATRRYLRLGGSMSRSPSPCIRAVDSWASFVVEGAAMAEEVVFEEDDDLGHVRACCKSQKGSEEKSNTRKIPSPAQGKRIQEKFVTPEPDEDGFVWEVLQDSDVADRSPSPASSAFPSPSPKRPKPYAAAQAQPGAEQRNSKVFPHGSVPISKRQSPNRVVTIAQTSTENATPTPTPRKRRSSSVWEQGEKFWADQASFGTPTRDEKWAKGNNQRVEALRKGNLGGAPASDRPSEGTPLRTEGTPGSHYDGAGFLKV